MFMKRMLSSLFVFTVFMLLFFTAHAYAASDVKRISGQNRYGTAEAIAFEGWESSDWAVIASGEDFPDALAAAPLAAKYDAPILLTEAYSLRNETRHALESLHVKNVFIIGGQGAISANVDKKLEAMGINVTRIAGQDRFETAVKIAERLDGFGEIAVATGDDFPDALSIAPAAAKRRMPIILVSRDKVPQCVSEFIMSRTINKTYIVGDITAVSFEVEFEFPGVERIGSLGRYFTNSSVESRFADNLNSGKIYLTRGDDFADALAGSVLAAKNSGPIMFLGSDYVKQAEYIFNKGYDSVILLGDYSTIGAEVERELKNIGSVIKMALKQKRFGTPYVSNVVADGSWVYFYRKDYYSDDIVYGETAIYRMKADGSDCTKIEAIGGKDVSQYGYEYILGHRPEFIINKELKSFYIKGDWIYYKIEGDSNEYKVKKDNVYDIQ